MAVAESQLGLCSLNVAACIDHVETFAVASFDFVSVDCFPADVTVGVVVDGAIYVPVNVTEDITVYVTVDIPVDVAHYVAVNITVDVTINVPVDVTVHDNFSSTVTAVAVRLLPRAISNEKEKEKEKAR